MSKKKYPSGEEVRHFLTDFSFEVSPELKFDQLVKEVIQSWEIGTGWHPFLMRAEESLRTFTVYKKLGRSSNGQVGFVDLRGGLIDIIKITDEKGNVLEPDKDYHLYPEYSDLGLDGYEWMELAGNARTSRKIDIVGKWGAFEKVPLAVWSGIIKKAAADALACFSCSKDARLESWSEGGVTEKYKTHPFMDIIKRWDRNFNGLLRKYRRVPLFI